MRNPFSNARFSLRGAMACLVFSSLSLTARTASAAESAIDYHPSSTGQAKPMNTTNGKTALATFAGGCFWCTESAFDDIPGVINVVSGYSGGQKPNPTYEEVCTGTTGYLEAVQVTYDPTKVSYITLLNVFWHEIDPTDEEGQFADRGSQYHAAVLYHNAEQKRLAEESKEKLAASKKFSLPIITPIREYKNFYAAEEYHQHYCKRHSERYHQYRVGSGRQDFLENAWKNEKPVVVPVTKDNDGVVEEANAKNSEIAAGNAYCDPSQLSDEDLKKKLTPEQYEVTRKNGTERPFANAYWDNHREGLYVDIVSGEPLFSSKDKYNSGTGWPSFTKPVDATNVVEKTDATYGMERTEVRSKHGDSHLGHVFDDGPGPTHQRFCINSASLKFIPKEDLDKDGYGKYKYLFESK